MLNTEKFIERCKKSSQEAYEAFKALLIELERPETRGAALEFVHTSILPLLQKRSPEDLTREYHFALSELELQLGDEGETRLLLLQLPSTFAPEEWSFTFYEGLTRYKVAEFQDRRIAELGCGIGWISLALAKQTKPVKVYGLDINPRAIVCSRINLYLNGFGRDGKPTWEHEGRTLADVVEFHVSDLLEHCRVNKINFDRVIGCIPQVLNPDPDFTARMLRGSVKEHESDEFLHSLSNYAPQQGHIEDQFGLGLIARAVEESVDVLRSSGKLILNLGGRPGKAVLQRLFLRRGFNVHPVWNTRVSQAKDTDIRGLVAIEERTAHRFEFFVEHGGDAPVSARTALAFAEAGGEIAHGLSVYEARVRDPQHVPRVLRLLRQPGYEDARGAIDLSYTDDGLAEEKISFLSELAEQVEGPTFFPYEKTAGLASFRRHLGAFFRNYFKIYYEESHFVVAPSTAAVCRNLMALFRPKRALIDSELASVSSSPLAPGTLEIPRNADLLCEMIEKLKPELVIYTMPQVEAQTRDAFLRILEVSERCRTRVFIDVSELIELSSTPSVNGVFRYLAQSRLPAHAGLICGLVKNRLYQDLQVSFVISENQDLLENLVNAAELSYSRTPVLSQLYYDRILQDLLNFQLAESARGRAATERSLVREDGLFRKAFIGVCPEAESAFKHPAITGERLAQKSDDFIRLDYGENSLPAPQCLKRSLYEAFAKMQVTAQESDPSPELLELVKRRMGLGSVSGLSVALSGGVAPLFAAMAADCAQAKRSLIFPAGAYGYFVAAARFYGASTAIVETHAQDRFKLTPESLDRALARVGAGAWVVLSAPVVNPTGIVYGSTDIAGLLAVAQKHRALLVLDSIFSGLEFDPGHSGLSGISFSGVRWALLGGLSKEFAAGGLRIGYGVTGDEELLRAWEQAHLAQPHATLRLVLKRSCIELLRGDSLLSAELLAQRKILGERSARLCATLRASGWVPLEPQGGLFLTATPAGLLGKKSGKAVLTLENLADLLRERTGIVINTPGWTGMPGYFRFVLSVPELEFEEALAGLKSFFGELKE